MKNLIKKYALANAFQYGGKADKKAVLGKLLAEQPKLRSKAAKIQVEVENIVAKINIMSLQNIEKELLKVYPEFFKRLCFPMRNLGSFKKAFLFCGTVHRR